MSDLYMGISLVGGAVIILILGWVALELWRGE